MKKFEMVKAAGSFVVSIGVGAIVGNAIKATTPSTVGALNKLAIKVGALVITNMVGDYAVNYAEGKIDSAVQTIKDTIKEVESEEVEEV